jgi:hypothetical protein
MPSAGAALEEIGSRIGTTASCGAVIELEQGRISRSWQPDAMTSHWRPWPNPGLRMFRLVQHEWERPVYKSVYIHGAWVCGYADSSWASGSSLRAEAFGLPSGFQELRGSPPATTVTWAFSILISPVRIRPPAGESCSSGWLPRWLPVSASLSGLLGDHRYLG